MNSTPVAQELIDSELAERDLYEIIDALETGVLQLRQERDHLRETLALGGAQPVQAKRKPIKKTAGKKAAGKKAGKKSAKKAVAKAVKVVAAPDLEVAGPKPPAKTRSALGRTLTMIRSPRAPNP